MSEINDYPKTFRQQVKERIRDIIGNLTYNSVEVLVTFDDIYTLDLRQYKYIVAIKTDDMSEIQADTIGFPAAGERIISFNIACLVSGERDGDTNLSEKIERLTSVVENKLSLTKEVLLLNTSDSTIIRTKLGNTSFEGSSDFSDSIYTSNIAYFVNCHIKENAQFLQLQN